MLKSSNLNSVINELETKSSDGSTEITTKYNENDNNATAHTATTQLSNNINNNNNNNDITPTASAQQVSHAADDGGATATTTSLAAQQLADGFLQITEPPLARVRAHLKELIGKQNKIYIDLSKEKFKLDCSEVAKLTEMMNGVKYYKEKLIKIKKQMQSIYQRTKALKKRAANIECTKQREYQRKLDKQKQEESLIAQQQT